MPARNTSIIANGESFDIGRRVVLWDEPDGLNGYDESDKTLISIDRKTGKETRTVIRGKRYAPRTAERMKREVINFTVHHSVTYTAAQCFNVLHFNRKLSVNFIIDDDAAATIYQTLDIKDVAFSQGPCNETGPGVEICWMPQAWENPSLYADKVRKKYRVQDHAFGRDTVHGRTLKIFKPTDAQVAACTALLWGFSELFPHVRHEFPKDKDDKVVKTSIKKPVTYNGFMGHFHITKAKIDPLGFPFALVEKGVAERRKWGI
jgi:hypothetical protein